MKTAAERIEMTRKNLMSVPGYNFNEAKLKDICETNDYIPEGAHVMSNGDEKVYFEGDTFVTKNGSQIIKSFAKSTLSEMQQEQLFCIWAGKQVTI